MVKYTCTICLKEFSKKYNFEMHTMNKKKPCQPINNIIDQNLPIFTEIYQNSPESYKKIEKHSCEYCEKDFTTIYTLKRHVEGRCKVKKEKEEESNKQNEFLVAQVMELKRLLENQTREIEEMKKKKSVNKLVINNNTNTLNTGNINTNTNNIKTNTNNINLMAHGKEDFSKIELKSILDCLCNENFQEIVPSMVKHIYIDPAHPEFHNFKVLDLARNKSEYYNGKDWVVGKADDGLLTIFENVNSVLTEPFDKNNIDKTIKFIRNNEELKKKYKWIDWSKNYCINLFRDNDKEYIEDRNRILNDLKLIFYNYKDQILAS